MVASPSTLQVGLRCKFKRPVSDMMQTTTRRRLYEIFRLFATLYERNIGAVDYTFEAGGFFNLKFNYVLHEGYVFYCFS